MDKWKYTRAGRLLYSWRVDDGPLAAIQTTVARSRWRKRGGTARAGHGPQLERGPPRPRYIPSPWCSPGTEPLFLALSGLGMVLLGVSLAAHFSYHRNRLAGGRTYAGRRANQPAPGREANQAAYEKVVAYQNQLQGLASRCPWRKNANAAWPPTCTTPSAEPGAVHDSSRHSGIAGVLRQRAGDRAVGNDRSYPQHSRVNLGLCPPILYEVGFEAAIEQLADQIEISTACMSSAGWIHPFRCY